MIRFPKAMRHLLLGYLALHLVAVGIFLLILIHITRNQMILDEQSRMKSIATILASYVDQQDEGMKQPDLPDQLILLGEKMGVRLTIIDSTGVVVADSMTGVRDIGPHGTREEILRAQSQGSGFSERYSDTIGQPMMYYATAYHPVNANHSGGFLRIAISAASIDSAIRSIRNLIWMFAILTSTITGILMVYFSARNMEPLNQFSLAARRIGLGRYERSTILKYRRDEWGELAEAFEQMQDEIALREDNLLENSQRLEAVLSSMIEGVIAIDGNGIVMLANEAACRMLSLSLGELLGRKLLEMIRIPELQDAIARTQLQRKFSKSEFSTLSDPPRRLKVRVTVLAKQSQRGIAIVLHDVTELRQLETMRQDFVANVSHELKTPLSSIKAYAETLKMGALYDQKKNLHFVEQIESQAEQLERQIHDLLELAKVESGKAAFQFTEVDINDVCAACFHQFLPHAEKNLVRLESNNCAGLPLVRADRAALETIVKNLVANAIHYTLAGGTVSIETKIELHEAIIQVSDTGIGIAADQQSRIFERFYRVDRARSRDKGGTGLGLSIVKHLTQAFDGTVHLESQLGKGSRFQVRIPLTE